MNSADDAQTDSGADAWMSVCDNLLWGFNHALSNRLAAISSIARILEYSDTGLDPLLSVLSDEIASLEGTLKLLRLVPGNPHGSPEPLLLQEMLPEVVRLHEVRGDVSEFEFELLFEGEAQPLWAEPARVAHALLIALGAVSRVAMIAGKRRIRIVVDSTEEVATVVIAVADGDNGARLGPVLAVEEIETVKRLIGPAGGEVSDAEERVAAGQGVEIRIPTLLATRARERAGQ